MRIGNKQELNCKRHCKLNRREVRAAFLPATMLTRAGTRDRNR
jgi:hypothetical protein